MPLILERSEVLDIYREASERKWVLPTFNVENLTTTEAILAAAYDYGQLIGQVNLPIIIGITNNYEHRPQAVYYTHTRKWELGMRLFLSDMQALLSEVSPFGQLRVMIHLDHIQWDHDRDLLEWDLGQFSSIMYDVSTLPLEKNIQLTATFVKKNQREILIEGLCDEIRSASGAGRNDFTDPDLAERYFRETGVDILVANLGTEHRAAASHLQYRSDIAQEISRRLGPRLCLHGTSSVPAQKLGNLFADGICKVNIWTALERDSSPILFEDMVLNAAKITGQQKARDLVVRDLLGKKVDLESNPALSHFTTTYRQGLIFQQIKNIISSYLKIWYV
jgi:fructose-bisphosphate aldolase, class II